MMGLLEKRWNVGWSRWNPGNEAGEWRDEVSERGMRDVWEGKELSLSLPKHGVVEGWMPEPACLVARGSLRESDSTIKRTNGHGSMRERDGAGERWRWKG